MTTRSLVSWAVTATVLAVTSTAIAQHTKIIPGHGPITDRNSLIATRDLILAVCEKVAALIAQEKTLDEVIAAKPTADFDAQVPQGAQSAARFIKWVYTDLKAQS
jgi:cyclase